MQLSQLPQVVAVDRLAEIAEQPRAAAGRGFAQADQRIELAARHPLERVGAGRLVDHAPLLHDVLQAIGHPCVGRLAVAAGAAGLLVVGLDALRQVEVGDEAHVRLVDAHAEGDRRDDDDAVLVDEAVLVARARRGVQAGMIGERRDAGLDERGDGVLDLGAREAVDDAGFARVPLGDELLRAALSSFVFSTIS